MIYEFCEWLQATPFGVAVSESGWMFPAIESAHVIFIALVVGSIAIVDLRLLGLASNNTSIVKLSDEVIRWTWIAFVLAVITGVLLFASNATGYYANVPFRWKMLLLVLAGVNMLVFQFLTYRSVKLWEMGKAPTAARVGGALSLTFWIGVVAFGRWIGFV